MRIKTFIQRKALRMLMMAMAVLPLYALVSCDNSFIYDYEGDCSVTYRLKFRYDKNLKWADAFANEVGSVHVYAFDKDGVLVWQKAENGAALAADGYAMTLDMPAGDYDLIAWCGLDNEDGKKSFSVPEMTVGTSRKEELQCSLKREHITRAGSEAHSKEMLDFLFHGMIEVNLPQDEDGGTYEYLMPLTKDTNHIRVMLQHLSAKDVNVDDFTFTIGDENGLMDYDNELLEDENIIYDAWNTESGIAGIISGDEIVDCKTAIADITVARMMKAHDRKMMLTITRNEDGQTVARIPVMDYALLGKEYYETAYRQKMTDQDFLDRQDELVMTFFIDKNYRWPSAQIEILSWRVVIQNVNLD